MVQLPPSLPFIPTHHRYVPVPPQQLYRQPPNLPHILRIIGILHNISAILRPGHRLRHVGRADESEELGGQIGQAVCRLCVGRFEDQGDVVGEQGVEEPPVVTVEAEHPVVERVGDGFAWVREKRGLV
jgi:hypothetical protein